MPEPFVDTDVLIRLLTGDDPHKQVRAKALFADVETGRLTVRAPDTVVADAVYVLASPRLYHLPRLDVRDLRKTLVGLPHFKVANRDVVLLALDIYAASALDFGDAMVLAAMQLAGSVDLYSYDRDFDRFPQVRRAEP
jgi:predicted nucleic acid-binding protein